MYDHRFMVINSVFPTTTVAATTAITTGRYPIETGYMGWCQYFSKANKTYEVFSSKNWCNPLDKFPVGITNSILKINYITDDINKKANKTISSMVMFLPTIAIKAISSSSDKEIISGIFLISAIIS